MIAKGGVMGVFCKQLKRFSEGLFYCYRSGFALLGK